MSPKVRSGNKGKVRVEFDTTRALPEEALNGFAHDLRRLKGVKRAMVRSESGRPLVFIRINMAVPGLVRKIDQMARRFWRSFYAPPTPRRRGGRTLHNKPLAMRARQRCKRQPPKFAIPAA